jgi:hypothetical protein
MQRSKTHRKRTTPAPEGQGGPFMGDNVAKATEDSLNALFSAENEATFHQTWQKLDRGSRLNRLRTFVQEYPSITPAERASLLTAILQAFELRQLNTKTSVEYDVERAKILTIRGLRERMTPTGFRTFRIDVSSITRTTQKQRKVPEPAKQAQNTTNVQDDAVLNPTKIE